MMKKKILLLSAIVMLLGTACSQNNDLAYYQGSGPESRGDGLENEVRVHIIYDNYVSKKGTIADRGYSVLIDGTEKSVLFDTGTNPEILAMNLETMSLSPEIIDEVVISHEHGDHTGGLGKSRLNGSGTLLERIL